MFAPLFPCLAKGSNILAVHSENDCDNVPPALNDHVHCLRLRQPGSAGEPCSRLDTDLFMKVLVKLQHWGMAVVVSLPLAPGLAGAAVAVDPLANPPMPAFLGQTNLHFPSQVLTLTPLR